jgi:hypothetical protein
MKTTVCNFLCVAADFTRGQVALEAGFCCRAKITAHRTADLGRDAAGCPVRSKIRHEHSLNGPPVMQAQK